MSASELDKVKQIHNDEKDLHQFGYAQQLLRDMGGFASRSGPRRTEAPPGSGASMSPAIAYRTTINFWL